VEVSCLEEVPFLVEEPCLEEAFPLVEDKAFSFLVEASCLGVEP
jgi:hypothetical protein